MPTNEDMLAVYLFCSLTQRDAFDIISSSGYVHPEHMIYWGAQ